MQAFLETLGINKFEPEEFISHLSYMAKGMLAIILVIAVIMGVTVLLNKLSSKKQ